MAKRGGMKRSHLSTNKEESANDESEAVKSPKKRRIIGEEPTEFGNYLDTERLRGFKCPKKGDDAPSLEYIPVNPRQSSEYAKEIKPILERSFKTKDFLKSFVVKDCCHLRNKNFEQEYAEKRLQFRQNSDTPKDMQKLNEYYGFVYAKTSNQITEWCKEGIRNGNAPVSHLGESKSGVSLSQYVDLVCPTASLPKEGWICIVKYFKGRAKHVPPCASPMEPQPDFDCHITVPKPSRFNSGKLKENDDVAFSNQIFLFEYNEYGELVLRPRHVLPYAAVQYTFELSSAAAALQTRDTNDPKMNSRLLAQKERKNQQNDAAAKTFLSNRQHPGVPLTEVRPRPPKLGCRTAQDLFSSGSLHPGGPPKRRKEKKASKATKKKEAEANFKKPAEPQNTSEPPQQTPPSPVQESAAAAASKTEDTETNSDREEGPAPNVGKPHFSGGVIVSVARLKVGSKFQGKMDLVTYADKIVYPVAVLSSKLCVRRFIPMASLLANEMSGVRVSLKDEFVLADGIHHGAYYRFYLHPPYPSMIPLTNLKDYMEKRQKVATVSFANGSKELLMFPDCEFASAIGIPPIVKSTSTQSTLFLHCLLLSDTPRHDYYSCLREPIVAPDLQQVDEVLASYIWADMDLPPVDEEDAKLQDSYGGVWPCVEALTQLLSQMNEVQSKRFRHLLGKSNENSEPLAYQPLDFTRNVQERVFPVPESNLDDISMSKEDLLDVLANVHIMEQQKHIKQQQEPAPDPVQQMEEALALELGPCDDLVVGTFDDSKDCVGDWRNHRKDLHCGVGSIFRSMEETPTSPPPLIDCGSHGRCEGGMLVGSNPEPQMVRYSKTVFEEPPSSPVQGLQKSLSRKDPPTKLQPSTMSNQLAIINAEMKEMLNVIRTTMYENKTPKTEGVAIATTPPEPDGSFDAYDLQNRAAKAARERGSPGEDEEEDGNGHGINNWYWEYYRKSKAENKETEVQAAKQDFSPPVPIAWARNKLPIEVDVSDEEIHRILDEGMADEEKHSSKSKSPPDTSNVGNFNSPVSANRKDLRFLRMTPQAGSSVSKVFEESLKKDVEKVAAMTDKSDDASLSVWKIDDAKPMSKIANQESEVKTKSLTAERKKNEEPPRVTRCRTQSPPLTQKTMMASPSSSMSISSADDVETEIEVRQIPVMVNRKTSRQPSPPRNNVQVVPAVFPPLSVVPLMRVPLHKDLLMFSDKPVTKGAP